MKYELPHKIPIKSVLENLGDTLHIFHGEPVGMTSQRYLLFKLKGVKCVTCGVVGTHFKLGRGSKKERYHLNLYTDNNLLMTKDHIKPKKFGGTNTMDNYQPMCTTCNCTKGSTYASPLILKDK